MIDLLIISPTPTHPANAGNRARIRALLECFEESGVDFHFAFFRQEDGDEKAMAARWGADRCSFLDFRRPEREYSLGQRLRNKLCRLAGRPSSIPYRIDDWCGPRLIDAVRELAERQRPGCVMVEYVFFSKLFDCFSEGVYKVLDTHDIVSDRDKMFSDRGWNPEWFYTTRGQEAVGINRADCVIAIQSGEAAHFRGMTSVPVVTVGHIVELRPPVVPITPVPTVMFLGSGNTVNQEALKYLLEEIWPSIRAAVPNAVLEVYGAICKFAGTPAAGVSLMGGVNDLTAAYGRAWVVVSPLRMGTGLKIKSIEALGLGKALVSAPAGYTGLEDGLGTAYLPGDLPSEFIENCVNLLCDAPARKSLEASAYDFASRWNERQRDELLRVLEMGGATREPKATRPRNGGRPN
jgi:hypothetical protein